MEKTWRWFGKKDKITLDMLVQIGVEGVVTALHEVPNGEVWTYDAIVDLKKYIESFGLRWSVVESLPVSESIKYGGADRERLLENYRISLSNLGKAGVHTVCYNFMPVIDWVRTDLFKLHPDGTRSLHFEKSRFAYFDIYIVQREGAKADYSASELEEVEALAKVISESEKEDLIQTIIVRTQGFVNGNITEEDEMPVNKFRQLLKLYDGIDKNQLRANLKYFLESVIPTAETAGVNLCVHPDDPPFAILGLPRIVTSGEDIDWFLNAVDSSHNGLTFCAGSLSAGLHNDVPALARKFAKRTHFVHLRSTEVDSKGNFTEAAHHEGRGHLVELLQIFEQENPGLPMRVDHGKYMLGDQDKGYNAGYSFLGRMYALAQVSGMMTALGVKSIK